MLIAPRDMIIVKVHYDNNIHVKDIGKGNIIIPETYGGKENIMEYYGEVISVGLTCPFRHKLSSGDKILFHRNEGITVKDGNGNEFKSLQPRAVLCKDMV